MSPRKVNKEEKRREIALACSDLIHDVGMKKLTIAQVAKTAGIGKGTVYEYFENKEDIIFEIINIHIEEHHKEFNKKIKKLSTTREKIELFFNFIFDDSEENLKHFEGYKEFLSIVLSENNELMKKFNYDKNEYFCSELLSILNDAVIKGELKEEVIDLANGIMTYQKGMALRKMSQINYNPREDFNKFMDTLFKLFEIKNLKE